MIGYSLPVQENTLLLPVLPWQMRITQYLEHRNLAALYRNRTGHRKVKTLRTKIHPFLFTVINNAGEESAPIHVSFLKILFLIMHETTSHDETF